MNNSFVIIAIIGAFIVGAISANPIVDAVKPLQEFLIANDSSNPIPVTVFSRTLSVTGSGTIKCEGVFEDTGVLDYTHLGDGDENFGALSDSSRAMSLIGGTLTRTSDGFQVKGIVENDPICGLDEPTVYTMTGECGFEKSISFTTDSGIEASLIGNAACP